jgi:hypothetical protein
MKTLRNMPGGYGHEHAEWLIGPVGQHRDSDAIERSNFEVTTTRLNEIDPEGNDHEVHHFGHFAVGWVEEIATRPGSPCAALADDIRAQLEGYAILDEMHCSQLEAEESDNE